MEVHGVEWFARIWVSVHPEVADSMESVFIRLVSAKDEQATKVGLHYLVDLFAKGRVCIFRVQPEVNSETDFDTKATTWVGYARFHYLRQPGEWSVELVGTEPVLAGFGKEGVE